MFTGLKRSQIVTGDGLEEVDLRHKGFWHYTPNIKLLGITGEPQRNEEVPIWSKKDEIWMITYGFKGLITLMKLTQCYGHHVFFIHL